MSIPTPILPSTQATAPQQLAMPHPVDALSPFGSAATTTHAQTIRLSVAQTFACVNSCVCVKMTSTIATLTHPSPLMKLVVGWPSRKSRQFRVFLPRVARPHRPDAFANIAHVHRTKP